MKKSTMFLIPVVAGLAFTACNKGGFKKTDSGLMYKVFVSKDGAKPKEGDLVTMDMVYKMDKDGKDSVLFDTRKMGRPVVVPIGAKPSFKGGIEEGFAMLSVGDSAEFQVPADSIFEKTFHAQLPPFIKKGTMLTFVLKMEKIQPKTEVEAEMKAKQEAQMKEMEERKTKEPMEIENYVKANNIKVKANADGLYYIQTKAGSGAAATEGKTVSIEYTGKFLDGRVFDTSVGKGQPLEFQIGKNGMIKGFEQGVKMMKVGGKANIIMPSALAYGAQGMQGGIPPYTPIMFEIELLSVK
jgi:FKBP-type peptidyl-prolyl cis-trans isomerase FkpA